MKKLLRLGLTAVLVAVMLLAIIPASSVLASSRFEYYLGEDAHAIPKGQNWYAQTFTPSVEHTITSVKLKCAQSGYIGTVTVSIRATSSGYPVGIDLCSGTFEGSELSEYPTYMVKEVFFGEGYGLSASTQYAIILRAADAVDPNCFVRVKTSGASYSGGCYYYSNTSGSGWSKFEEKDFWFEEWGEIPILVPEARTDEATDVGYNEGPRWFEATLNGIVVDDGGEPCNCFFLYQIKDADDWKLCIGIGYKETDESFDFGLINLLSETTYEYYAYIENSEGNHSGETLEFTTEFVVSDPSVLTYGYPIVLGDYDCCIYGGIGYDGGSLCDAWFEWREKDAETWIEQGATNLVLSGGFELPDPLSNWGIVGAGATRELSTTEVKEGTYSLKVTRNGTDCFAEQLIPEWERFVEENVTIGAWVWSSTADTTNLMVFDVGGYIFSDYHTGSSEWEWLSVKHTLSVTATELSARLRQIDSNVAVYFDEVVLVRGETISSTGEYGELLETGEGANTLVTGLDQLQWYEFRMVAENDEGIGTGGISSFILYGALGDPQVRTDGIQFLKNTSVWLMGTLVDDGEGPGCWVGFEWRKVGSSEWQDTGICGKLYSGEDWSTDIQQLTPEMNYEYRAYARHAVLHSEEVYGEVKVLYTYSTKRLPIVRTREAENIDVVSLRLCSTLDYDGGYDCDVWFQYRLLGDSLWTTTDAVQGVNSAYDVETVITNLLSDYYYEYRALASNDLGTGYGETMSTCVVAEGTQEEDLPELPPTSPIVWVDRLLETMGLDNTIGHLLIVLAIMGGAYYAFRRSTVLSVLVPLMVFGGSIVVGWIEFWIVLLLALGAGITLFGLLRKKVAGGG